MELASTKYQQVSKLLERRILNGDYLLKDFPTDRQLSAEFQVDTRTARKAVAKLVDIGLLVRQSNGRPAVMRQVRSGHAQKRHMRIALLSIAYPTPYTLRWQRSIQRLVDQHDWMLRQVTYTHLDDAIISDTLEGFDAVFFGMGGEDPTPHLLRTIERSGKPVVFLDNDLSDYGFPSIWLASPALTTNLLIHLKDRGHQRIACLNTQPHNAVTNMRIHAWQTFTSQHAEPGKLIDVPADPFTSPVERAYQAAKQVIHDGGFDATALLCCTSPSATGVYRAMHEARLQVGRDLAICSADDGAGAAAYFVPSLTALQDPDPTAYLSVCIDWIDTGGRNWKGPLLVQPREVPIFIGESTTLGDYR